MNSVNFSVILQLNCLYFGIYTLNYLYLGYSGGSDGSVGSGGDINK